MNIKHLAQMLKDLKPDSDYNGEHCDADDYLLGFEHGQDSGMNCMWDLVYSYIFGNLTDDEQKQFEKMIKGK